MDNVHAQLAALPPYDGMESLWKEQAMQEARQQRTLDSEERLSWARALHDSQSLAVGIPFSARIERNESPPYDYPEYGLGRSDLL